MLRAGPCSNPIRNHCLRWLAAVVFIPAFYTLLEYGPAWGLDLFILLCVQVCLWEFFRLAQRSGMTPYRAAGHLLSLLLCLTFTSFVETLFSVWGNDLDRSTLLVFIALLALILQAILTSGPMDRGISQVPITMFGVLLVTWPLGHLLLLSRLEPTPRYLYLFLATIWIADSAAFYAGRLLGRHKLAPKLSPNKTWEGFVAGCCCGALAMLAAQAIWLPGLPWDRSLGLGALTAVAAQAGDLFESLLKRGAAQKDAGRVVPGHGGLLDRADSVFISAPLFFYLIKTIAHLP
jgi:phosphatidate cytidylyltransferase